MRSSVGSAVLLVGVVAGYITGQQALGRAGQVPVPNSKWVQDILNPKDTYALYAAGHFRSAGQLPPNRATLLYTREVDEEGTGLRSSCSYQLSGHEPDARWWSVNVAPAGGSSVAASFTARDVIMNSDSEFSLAISKHASTGNWLQPSEFGAMRVILILNEPYVTGKTHGAALPTLKRVGCE